MPTTGKKLISTCKRRVSAIYYSVYIVRKESPWEPILHEKESGSYLYVVHLELITFPCTQNTPNWLCVFVRKQIINI